MQLLLLFFLACPGEEPKDCTDQAAWWPDSDADGFGDELASSETACEAPGSNWVNNGRDCDDTDANTWPGAGEVCDGVDNDCDGTVDEDGAQTSTWYADTDADGYGDPDNLVETCEELSGYVQDASDCDDTDSEINPGGIELCDGLDNDCDGNVDGADAIPITWYADADGDGYGDASTTLETCEAPSDYVLDGTDCNDSTAAAHPGATEICDGLDNDCNNDVDEGYTTYTYYADNDGDGIGSEQSTTIACSLPSGYAEIFGDCDDSDASEPAWADPQVAPGGNGSASTPFDSIQDAIIAGYSCVLAAPGTYTESITVYSQSIDVTSLEGSATTFITGTNGPAFFLDSSPSTTITGFTVIGGQGYNAPDDYLTELGHAFFVDGGTVWLTDIVVDGITATLLHNGTDDANGALALYATHNATVDLEDFTVQNVQGTWGAAIYISESTITGRRLALLNNGVGFSLIHIVGILDVDAVLTAGNYRISDSWSGNKTLFYMYDGEVRLRNASIIDNYVDKISQPSNARNTSDPDDQGAHFSIESSIIAFNSGASIFHNTSLAPSLSHTTTFSNVSNDSSSWADAGGNLTVDPLFVSLTQDGTYVGDDAHLQTSSQCIDAGVITETDPDGSRADMGAYGGPDATW